MNSNRIDRIKNNENTQAFIMPGHFFSIAFYWLAAGIKTILHTIKMNEVEPKSINGSRLFIFNFLHHFNKIKTKNNTQDRHTKTTYIHKYKKKDIKLIFPSDRNQLLQQSDAFVE